MNLVIDNNDGLGGVDYTSAILQDQPLTIVRRRGAWAQCACGLDVQGAGLPVPQDRARVLVSDATATVLFRGFLQASPCSRSVGSAVTIAALEEGWLMGAAPADELQPATAATHSLALEDTEVVYDDVSRSTDELATDVTVFGGHEPAAYVTELFRGDGTTQTFAMAHAPFREPGGKTLLTESFDDPALNPATWSRTDPGGYLALGAGGLQMTGGNGFDGATLLRSNSAVEMGGTLVAEAAGVQLATGSDGLLLGFYNGSVVRAGCLAGIRVRGMAGAHTLVAVVNGAEQTSTYSFADGHRYTLRVRLHCGEVQRVRNTYRALADGTLLQFGGGVVDAPLHLVMEVQDLGLASSTPATVLFDGAVAGSPAGCVFAPVNSTQLVGSIATISLQQVGSAWVVSTAADGTVTTRREGAVGTGADYAISDAGVLVFDPGRVPQPGELLTVRYRRVRRACARVKDASADQVRQQLALPGLPAWVGSVESIATVASAGLLNDAKPRSTADCRAAAQALLVLASGEETHAGHVRWVRGAASADDVLPGDTVALATAQGDRKMTAQSVTIVDSNSVPERLVYRMTFDPGRAANLSFTVSDHMPQDGVRPAATTGDEGTLPVPLAGLQVTVATGSALQIDSGVDAPAGGGFEVRRSDANFGSPSTGDLVLNSPVRSFSIPRQGFAERFFVRMYDGSTPPLYSPVSSMVLTSLPLG